MIPNFSHASTRLNVLSCEALNPIISPLFSHNPNPFLPTLAGDGLGNSNQFSRFGTPHPGLDVALIHPMHTFLTQKVLSPLFQWTRNLELRLGVENPQRPRSNRPGMSDASQHLIWEMVRALEQNEFTLHYQPQIDLDTGHLLGVETLIRWPHPRLGHISPAHFIPIAEKTGLIVPIGYWVLKQSCLQYQRWRSLGIPPFKLSVNLSLRQLQEADLLTRIQTILEETEMNPTELALEVTESLMFQEPEKAIATLTHLKHLGIQIAIDDFGVGYSSLSYLKDLPVHTLKIDKSFLDDLLTAGKNQVILQSIIELGHRLALKIIAEGIESEEQLTILRQMKCDYGQGYLFSRPLGLAEITGYFQQRTLTSQFA